MTEGAVLTPPAGTRTAYQRSLAVKFALLEDCLATVGAPGRAAAHRIREQLAPLDTLIAQELVELGTPFFWLNVHRCHAIVADEGQYLDRTCRHLLTTAFDAYFDKLPDGTRFTLPAVEEAELLLPRLGVRLPAPAWPIELTRLAPAALAVQGPGRPVVIDLGAVDPALRVPRLPIAGRGTPRLLLARDPALFEDQYLDKVAAHSPAGPALAAMIGRSLDLIGRLDGPLGSRIAESVTWYVPISTPDVRMTHNSFTAPNLPGVMFLSEAYNDLRLAEAIVHEFGHFELNMVMETVDLLREVPGELFYSPWRDDPRPLRGLFHALYVFARVADFYARAARWSMSEPLGDQCRRRRQEICHQLRLGLAQVPGNRLAPPGRTIIEAIGQEVDRHAADWAGSTGELPAGVTARLQAWCKAHPELASSVRPVTVSR
ncbi:MAG TPA: HEXXH motif-containing putative peptide modification protein [Methylomirabilota bacterium]|jgi:HEXXH motif-containing protein|nr:HEXXH motif-containing putative peptide modification protein [Methylomirabilota bacterium]